MVGKFWRQGSLMSRIDDSFHYFANLVRGKVWAWNALQKVRYELISFWYRIFLMWRDQALLKISPIPMFQDLLRTENMKS